METYDELLSEVTRLRAWKKEAISVTPDMQAIGKEIEVGLGQSVHDKILPWIVQAKRRFLEWKSIEKDGYPEDSDFCLWIKYPVCEPPFAGFSPEIDAPDGYYTHYAVIRNEHFPPQ